MPEGKGLLTAVRVDSRVGPVSEVRRVRPRSRVMGAASHARDMSALAARVGAMARGAMARLIFVAGNGVLHLVDNARHDCFVF